MPTLSLIAPSLETPQSPRVAGTYGNLVVAWAAKRLNMVLGPWQIYSLQRILEHDDDGNLLARQALLSVGRQNGKSVIVRALVGYLLEHGAQHPILSSWDLVLLAAHDANQARIPYDFVRRDFESYAPIQVWGHGRMYGRQTYRSTMYNGLESHGVKVTVATRQAGSSRGMSPGLICFDEVLTQTDFGMYEVLSPAQSAIRNSLMLMTSTAGFSDSVVLRQMHDRLYRQSTGVEQADSTFMGLWWRADDDDIGLDWDELHKANPALHDGRLDKKMIEGEYAILPKGSWIRERLNRWHDERVDSPFTFASWGACRESNPLDPANVVGGLTIAVDVHANWGEGSIVIAGMRSDGRVGVVVHRYLQSRPETPLIASEFTQEVLRLAQKYTVDRILYTQSSALVFAMERLRVEHMLEVEAVSSVKLMQACSDFAEAVIAKRVAHNDSHLDSQVIGGQRRFIGTDGGWRWTISDHPVTTLIAATIAVGYASKMSIPAQVFI